MPLLISYVQSTLLSRHAIKQLPRDPKMLRTFETAARIQATLATRLRLAPQARTDPKTIARQNLHSYHGDGKDEPWDFK
jgi:hypothetical protein